MSETIYVVNMTITNHGKSTNSKREVIQRDDNEDDVDDDNEDDDDDDHWPC